MTIPFPCLKFTDKSSWPRMSLNCSARPGPPLRPPCLHVLYQSLPPGTWSPRVLGGCFSNMSLCLHHHRAGPTTHPSDLSQMAWPSGRLLCCHQSEFYSCLRGGYGSALKTRAVSSAEISVRVANMSETEDLKKYPSTEEEREYGWTHEAHGRIE